MQAEQVLRPAHSIERAAHPDLRAPACHSLGATLTRHYSSRWEALPILTLQSPMKFDSCHEALPE
jgi:hypothetical protein